VCFPITKTHPAKIVFAIVTLHMVASTILLDANIAFWAVFRMRRDIIGRFAVVGTLGKPSLYSFTACRRVVLAAALKTKSNFARRADAFLC
jgi:glucose-6-phosphate isomerase